MAERLNERLRVQLNWGDGSDWFDFDTATAPSLSAAVRRVMRYRADGAKEWCMAGYRVLDPEGRVVFVLAPICCRITGVRMRSTGESPETSTV